MSGAGGFRAPGAADFGVLGRNVPAVSVQQLKTGPDCKPCATTCGCGIRSFDLLVALGHAAAR